MSRSVKVSEHASAIALAALATAAAWVVTIRGAHSMSSSMPMPGGWSMSMAWMSMSNQPIVEHGVMFLTMWTVMMIAMMLPSVMPTVLLHRGLLELRASRGDAAGGSHLLLLAGYFSVWFAFGAIAYAAGMTLSAAAMRSIDISLLVPAATGVVLLAAGIYQMTQWKQDCLRHCRSPLDFYARHPIRCPRDSWMFGLHHGAYCAACCWGLMAIQLALGVMRVPLMAVVALVILFEKTWAHGETLARFVGAGFAAAGLALVLRAAIRG
jgi:predicted metal-binding membrane protein